MNQDWEITGGEDGWFIPPIWNPHSLREKKSPLKTLENVPLITARIRLYICAAAGGKFGAVLFWQVLPFVLHHFSLNYLLLYPQTTTSSYSREHFSLQAFYSYCLPHKMQTDVFALEHKGWDHISISQDNYPHIHFFFFCFLNASLYLLTEQRCTSWYMSPW